MDTVPDQGSKHPKKLKSDSLSPDGFLRIFSFIASGLRIFSFIVAAPRTDAAGNLMGIGSVCSGEYSWVSERTAWQHLKQKRVGSQHRGRGSDLSTAAGTTALQQGAARSLRGEH